MQHLVQTALGLRIEGLHKAKALQGGCLDLFCALIKTPDTFANNDFKLIGLSTKFVYIDLVIGAQKT